MTSYILDLVKGPFRSLLRPWRLPAITIPVNLSLNPTFGASNNVTVRMQRLTATAQIPFYATEGSAGMDLIADNEEPITLYRGDKILVPTGIAMALPVGFEAQIRPRSGLAAKNEVTVLNTPGTIDADYRGEVKVLLKNFGSHFLVIKRGDRIAQMVINRLPDVTVEEVEELDETARGDGGFGSTGVAAEKVAA